MIEPDARTSCGGTLLDVATTLEQGRVAFEERRWPDAVSLLGPAVVDDDDDAHAGAVVVEPGDLERLAVAAHLVGDDHLSDRAWERAHAGFAATGDRGAAARCAFWCGMLGLLRGTTALGNGWLARAEREASDLADDHPVRGLLLMVNAWFATLAGDTAEALALARRAEAVGEASGDHDLLALARLAHGEALVARGEGRAGSALLDEAMVGVVTGDVSPVATGIVYCAVIATCMDALDLKRAGEWTDALHGWCADQPGLVAYRGVCLVHRSQIFQAHGAWAVAEQEADRARQRLAEPLHPALGAALYQRAELHRVRGEHDQADALYTEAIAHGCSRQDGLALLRLAQGRLDAAVRVVQRLLDETTAPLARAPVLAAAVTIFLAAGDDIAADHAATELEGLVDAAGELVAAMAAHGRGAVLLRAGDPAAALVSLRAAARTWHAQQLPYESSLTSAVIADACRALGDDDGADLEEAAARSMRRRLGIDDPGSKGDEMRADPGRGAGQPASPVPDGLTARECEVLGLVALGLTNREIGEALVISQHTVARHVQNLFAKTGLRSRAAAATYAHQHGIAGSARPRR